MAEGLSLEATARLFELEPEAVAQWLALAANYFEALSAHLSQNLELEQVQLDDLYVKLRRVQSSDRTSVHWLYNVIDPVSKLWLIFRLGERGPGTVQSLVHRLVQQLAPGVIPLFLSDGERSYETRLLSHYGQWGQGADSRGQSRRRWLGLAEFAYVQVVKRRLRLRLVSVKHRLVRGQLKQRSTERGVRARNWAAERNTYVSISYRVGVSSIVYSHFPGKTTPSRTSPNRRSARHGAQPLSACVLLHPFSGCYRHS